MQACPIATPDFASLAREQRVFSLLSLALAAALAALAVAPVQAQAQDIVATGSQLRFDPIIPNVSWNSASWTGGQWGTANPPSPPSQAFTYSTGPYEIYGGMFNSTFNGQSLRIASGGVLNLSNNQGNTTTANLILDGGVLRVYESAFNNPTQTQTSFSGNIDVAADTTVDMTAVQDFSRLTFGNGNLTGGTTITGGTLSIASTASLPGFDTASAYSVGPGSSLAIGSTITDEELTDILATGNFQSGAGVGFDTTGGNRTYTGTIADTGSGLLALTKVGTGVLTLSGTNNYGAARRS